MNPRPAGYESANTATELAVMAMTCDDHDSVVAMLVATGTDDNACESVLSQADLRRWINALPSDLASVVMSWRLLSAEARQKMAAQVLTLAERGN